MIYIAITIFLIIIIAVTLIQDSCECGGRYTDNGWDEKYCDRCQDRQK